MFRPRVVLCCALCAGLNLFGADSLRFGAYSLDAEISGLIEQFPRSSHLFWLPDGHAVGAEDGAQLRDLIAHGTGQA